MVGLPWWDFPGDPMAKTLSSQCRGPGFNPWSGTRSHMPQLKKKKKKSCMLQSRFKTPRAATKTWYSQINKLIIFLKRKEIIAKTYQIWQKT